MINFKSNIGTDITALTRKGQTVTLGTFGTVDDSVMTCDGNCVYLNGKLDKVLTPYGLPHATSSLLINFDESPCFSIETKDRNALVDKTDVYACKIENRIRVEYNLPLRTHYPI